MLNNAIQAILAKVEKPSRYLGTEINRVVKDPAAVGLRMALAFPDLYDIGTSHFGIQILYHLLNRHPRIAAERVFAPADDMAAQLRQEGVSLFSLETQTPLRKFDIIGFSLLYELNFTNVLNMLDLAGIPLRAGQRSDKDPFVISGGPCVSNPEPMAPFFDAMVFGDGETVLPAMADLWLDWNTSGGRERSQLLSGWSALEGVYVPRFFEPEYDARGFQHLKPIKKGYSRIRRAIMPDLDGAFFPDHPVLPFGRPVHDRLRLEISRGCGRGCRFCQAGMIYRPVRERSMRNLLEIAASSLSSTGYEDLSLLSLSTGDYSSLTALTESLMQHCGQRRIAVSLPSIRADKLSPELMEQIKTVRKTGFTIAPEAGSQRLRDVINKNLSNEEIIHAVTHAFATGWQVIKLYFMIGLPTENDDDLEAIVAMVNGLKRIRPAGKRRGQINVSIGTFTPKPHTPFQWAAQISLAEAWDKIERLRSRLRLPGVQVKWQHPAMSLLEGAMARGDRRMAAVIERAFRLGCRFDGWSDCFDAERWRSAFAECGLAADFFTTRLREGNEPLPWAHMDARVEEGFLLSQWQAALKGAVLEECCPGSCHRCGVCDFKQVEPRRHVAENIEKREQKLQAESVQEPATFELTYSKREQARFFGHLELASIFARALRRAGIDVEFSQGYHPMPRISFDDPLPLGMESCAERLRLRVASQVACRDLMERLTLQLPQGLAIADCRKISAGQTKPISEDDHYHVLLPAPHGEAGIIENFLRQEQWAYARVRKGRTHTIDLKSYVQKIARLDDRTLELIIARRGRVGIRPADVLRSVYGLDEEGLASVRVIKRAGLSVSTPKG